MARGRKAQPAEIAEAKGNPGKRAQRAAPAVEAPELAGGAPQSLTAEGRKVWAELHKSLSQLKLLRQTDRQVFLRYCDTVAEYWKITRQLRRSGSTYLAPMTGGVGKMRRIDPRFLVQERLAKRLESMEDRLGLNPRARHEILHRLSNMAPQLPLGDQPDEQPRPDLDHQGSPLGFLN